VRAGGLIERERENRVLRARAGADDAEGADAWRPGEIPPGREHVFGLLPAECLQPVRVAEAGLRLEEEAALIGGDHV